jgi:NitT/TauT family transport system substrate-binding protein
MSRLKSLVGALFLSCALAASAAADEGAGPAYGTLPKIDIPYQAFGVAITPLWVAVDNGIFRNYGVDASTEFIQQSPAIVAAILSGELTFANVGEAAVITADLNGGDIEMLMSTTEKPLLELYARPELHNVADLKGKIVGVTGYGTTTDVSARYALRKAGLEPGRDATVLAMGSQANMLAALLSGRIQAAPLGSDTIFKADQLKGMNLIGRMQDYDLLFYTGSLVARRSWVEAHRAETLDVVKGYVAGIAATFRNKKAALAALAKYTKHSDPATLERSYGFATHVLLKYPLTKSAGVETALQMSKQANAKTADPKSFIDTSFITELTRDGFIDKLYK